MWNIDTYPAQYYALYTPGKRTHFRMDREWVNVQESPETPYVFIKQTFRRELGMDYSRPITIAGKRVDALIAKAAENGRVAYSVAAMKALIDETNVKTTKVYSDAKEFNEIKADIKRIKDELEALGF